jgi:DNA polymerase-3 subunit delta
MDSLVPFHPLKNDELIQWLKKRAQRFSVTLNDDAAQELMLRCKNQLQQLHNEIAKLSSYVGEGGEISLSLVRQLVARSLDNDVFTLIDKIIALDSDEAQTILHDLFLNKEEPLKILHLLARQFRILLQVKLLSARGFSTNQIAQALSLPPFVVSRALMQGKRLNETVLRFAIAYLAETDIRIKTGQIDSELSLLLFIAKFQDAVKNAQTNRLQYFSF